MKKLSQETENEFNEMRITRVQSIRDSLPGLAKAQDNFKKMLAVVGVFQIFVIILQVYLIINDVYPVYMVFVSLGGLIMSQLYTRKAMESGFRFAVRNVNFGLAGSMIHLLNFARKVPAGQFETLFITQTVLCVITFVIGGILEAYITFNTNIGSYLQRAERVDKAIIDLRKQTINELG